MTVQVARVAATAAIVAAVALVWCAFYAFNSWAFDALGYSRWVDWIFLPAAVRILAILLFGWRGVAGLIVGAVVTLSPADTLWPNMVVLPLTSGIGPWLAVQGWRKCFGLDDELRGLRPSDIAGLSVSCAVANSALLNLFLALTGQSRGDMLQIPAVIAGDAAGIAIVLFLLSLVLSWWVPARQA